MTKSIEKTGGARQKIARIPVLAAILSQAKKLFRIGLRLFALLQGGRVESNIVEVDAVAGAARLD
jgi:hypothetical protein